MKSPGRVLLSLGIASLLMIALACSGAGSDVMLGSGDPRTMASFAANGEIPVQEGLTLGADPEEIRLDPCDPDTPTDPDTGKMLGKSTIGAFLLDADLNPIVDAEVSFSTTAGLLESGGQPVLTDDRGLATDTLAVDEDDAGDVVITVTSGDLTEMLTVPVVVLPKPPVTLTMSPEELWPPNHRMRRVHAVFDGLDCDADATFKLVSVTSSEPDNDTGDGNTDDDIQGAEIDTADIELMLRAERAGGGDGRVYTLVYELTDGTGAISMLEATVTVPHDQGN